MLCFAIFTAIAVTNWDRFFIILCNWHTFFNTVCHITGGCNSRNHKIHVLISNTAHPKTFTWISLNEKYNYCCANIRRYHPKTITFLCVIVGFTVNCKIHTGLTSKWTHIPNNVKLAFFCWIVTNFVL